MRTLTLTRRKSFIGSLGRYFIYIKDPQGSEFICGTACTKLGALKNGETVSFEIPDGECSVYVGAGSVSRDFNCDLAIVPAGSENVALTGVSRFNPVSGNPFRFDGEPSEQAQQLRKQSQKRAWNFLIPILIGSAIAGLVAGVAAGTAAAKKHAAPKDFTVQNMTITLNENFSVEQMEGSEEWIASDHVGVYTVRDAFAEYEGLEDWTLQEYAATCFADEEDPHPVLLTDGNLRYYAYDVDLGDEGSYSYTAYVFKTQDAFWLVQFVTETSEASRYASDIRAWAQSVVFGN